MPPHGDESRNRTDLCGVAIRCFATELSRHGAQPRDRTVFTHIQGGRTPRVSGMEPTKRVERLSAVYDTAALPLSYEGMVQRLGIEPRVRKRAGLQPESPPRGSLHGGRRKNRTRPITAARFSRPAWVHTHLAFHWRIVLRPTQTPFGATGLANRSGSPPVARSKNHHSVFKERAPRFRRIVRGNDHNRSPTAEAECQARQLVEGVGIEPTISRAQAERDTASLTLYIGSRGESRTRTG